MPSYPVASLLSLTVPPAAAKAVSKASASICAALVSEYIEIRGPHLLPYGM